VTSLDTSIVEGQLGHISDHQILHSVINDKTDSIVNVRDYASVAAAAAAATDGQTLWFPGTTPNEYTTAVPIELASGVSWKMLKEQHLVCTAPEAGVVIPDPRTDFYNLNVNGGDDSLIPLQIGDPSTLTGAKCAFYGIDITNTGAGGTVCLIVNLQNSTGYNWRATANDLAATGFQIDYGTKNLGIYGMFSSTLAGPNLWVTTTGGGLSEVQSVNLGSPTTGTVTLTVPTFGTTSALARNATVATVQAAMDVALGSGNVVVSGANWPGTMIFSFTGTLGEKSIQLMTHTTAGGFNGTVTHATIINGTAVQQTSKINIYYGLMENADGIRLGDCEQVFLYQVGLNGGGTGSGIHIVAPAASSRRWDPTSRRTAPSPTTSRTLVSQLRQVCSATSVPSLCRSAWRR
jgi:hypothetical protein